MIEQNGEHSFSPDNFSVLQQQARDAEVLSAGRRSREPKSRLVCEKSSKIKRSKRI